MVINKIQKVLETVTAFVFLNLLWVVFCLPIITIFPATLAMFAIIRQWKMEGIEYSIGKPFFLYFKENFKKYGFLGVSWMLLGYILYMDASLFLLNGFKSVPLMSLLFVSLFLFIGMSIYIFPIIVHFQLKTIDIIKNTFLYTLGKLHMTFHAILLITIFITICYFFPVLLWGIGSLIGYLLYTIVSYTWDKQSNRPISLVLHRREKGTISKGTRGTRSLSFDKNED